MTRTLASSGGIIAFRTTSEPKPSSPRKMLPIPATRMRAAISSGLHAAQFEVAAGIRQGRRSQYQPHCGDDRKDADEYPTQHFHIEFLSLVCCRFFFWDGGWVERLDFVGGEVQITAVPVMQVGGRVFFHADPDVFVALYVFVPPT